MTYDYMDDESLAELFTTAERIIDAAPARLFIASHFAPCWPFILHAVHNAEPKMIDAAAVSILDSGFRNPDVDNADVLTAAAHYDPTYVVAKHYPAVDEPDRAAQEQTTESLKEFVELHDPTTDPPAFFPLQPPYAEHYPVVRDLMTDHGVEPRIMLGGLADPSITTARRIEETRALIDRIAEPADTHIHALGWGFDPQLATFLSDHPAAIDSWDSSGVEQAVLSGAFEDMTGTRCSPFSHPQGEACHHLYGLAVFYTGLIQTYRLTNLCSNGGPTPRESTRHEPRSGAVHRQSGLDSW